MINMPWKWTILVAIISALSIIVANYLIKDEISFSNEDEKSYPSASENEQNFLAYVQEAHEVNAEDGVPQRSEFLNQLKSLENDEGKMKMVNASQEVEYGYDFEIDRIVRDIENTTHYALEQKLPIILWWTPFTGEEGTVKKCSEGSCYFTQNRNFFDNNLTKALFFYGTNLDDNDLPLPRKDNHEWAVLHEESPKNNLLFHHEDFIMLFNHTCTFRQQSDYPITSQYLSSLNELQRKPVMNFKTKDKLDIASTIYLQSGCNPPSDRDAYVNELMKYLNVDSYGACLNNKQLPANLKSPLTMHDDSLRDFVGKYKFALTFENAICSDYITEKLWRPLAAGTVPVYKGAPNILEWLPDNKSVILVDNFATPKHLADFLNNLARNETAYNKYLSFKKEDIMNHKLVEHMKKRAWGANDIYKISFVTGFECFVCDRLHKNRKLKSEGKETASYIARHEHYGCQKPVTYPYRTPSGFEDWDRETWAEEYNEMKFKAKELYAKVAKRNV